MFNPTTVLKKAEQLVPTKTNKKGFSAKHSITLDDEGYLCLTIVVDYDKRKFHKMRIDNNSNITTVLNKNKDKIFELMGKSPVKKKKGIIARILD